MRYQNDRKFKLDCLSTSGIHSKMACKEWVGIVGKHLACVENEEHSNTVECSTLAQNKFSGRLEYGNFGQIKVARVSCSPGRYLRSQRTALPSNSMVLVLQLKGSTKIKTEAHPEVLVLKSGDWGVSNLHHPFEITTGDSDTQALYLFLNQQSLYSVKNFLLKLNGRAFGFSGIGPVIKQMLISFLQENSYISDSFKESFDNTLLELLLKFIVEESRSTSAVISAHGEIEAFIEDNLSNHELSVSKIANNFGWSNRHVHRVFARDCQETISGYLRRRRLESSYEELKCSSSKTITDIGYAWGFSCSSHFSRCFKEHFGIGPQELRKRQN